VYFIQVFVGYAYLEKNSSGVDVDVVMFGRSEEALCG
jgi:hypothetical protein